MSSIRVFPYDVAICPLCVVTNLSWVELGKNSFWELANAKNPSILLEKTVKMIYLSELHTHMFLLFPPITIVWD